MKLIKHTSQKNPFAAARHPRGRRHPHPQRHAGLRAGVQPTELKTGISNSLAVIMMFGFVLGISAVIYGGFAIRRGDVDQGK